MTRYSRGLLGAILLFIVPLTLAAEGQGRALLTDMADAHRALEYQGRLIYSQGGRISAMEVLHAVIDGRQYERLSHLDGDASELIRHGENVVSVDRNRQVMRVPASETLGPLDVSERMARVPEQYNVLVDGDDRVAAREAVRVRVVPLDEHRYGYRLWLDRESSLLLRLELVNARGQAMEQLEFVSLELQPELSREDFRIPGDDTDVFAAHDSSEAGEAGERDVPSLLAAGWLPEGFRAVTLDRDEDGEEPRRRFSQTFSDGLAAFTVFVEPAPGEDPELLHSVSRMGPTVAVSQGLELEEGLHLMTLIGEVPLETAEQIMSRMTLAEDRQ